VRFIDKVITNQGKDEYEKFIDGLKKEILGIENVKNLEIKKNEKTPKIFQ
jgi:hypothetical protein